MHLVDIVSLIGFSIRRFDSYCWDTQLVKDTQVEPGGDTDGKLETSPRWIFRLSSWNFYGFVTTRRKDEGRNRNYAKFMYGNRIEIDSRRYLVNRII